MRTITILPIAAAALVAGAIGAWGLGLASSRAVRPEQAGTICGPVAASEATGAKRRATVVASLRYRAETCSGDYVCGEDGAWEALAHVAGR